MSEATTRILILGGGFGGLYTALHLEKRLRPSDDVEITLVNRENHFLFTPMLHEVAASDLDITHIVNPIRKMLRRVQFFNGSVEEIELKNRHVTVSHGTEHHHHVLEYDHLVIALGSITNFYNLPGLSERALTMKSLGDAIALRNRLIEHMEEADFECVVGERDHLLTVVVAGGGFAGVETIAGVNDFLREVVGFYPHLSDDLVRVVLVHPGPVILPELGPKLGAYAQKKLSNRGVEIRVNTRVTGIHGYEVALSDGSAVKANTVVWTAGTSPNPIVAALPCEMERGRLRVASTMELPAWPGVWALGDCAFIPHPDSGEPYPPTAQHALREARVVAQNILATIRERPKKPFAFSTIGQLAAIGRRTGVANIFGMNFSGFVAWWLWRTIYLSKLPRLEKKLRVMLDWSLDLVFSKDLVQFATYRAPTVSHSEAGDGSILPAEPSSPRSSDVAANV
ncbi:MAG: NAD(P)/FAD-dependent oxidoreductase [Rhodothermales bacterium]|nr:NAD(P)/FAD-dependent oxidoreductase [Rhodothermales bacterium]